MLRLPKHDRLFQPNRLALTMLRDTGGNKTKAARQLGTGVKTLYRKLEEYGLSR